MSIATYITLQTAVGFMLEVAGKKLEKTPLALQNAVNYLHRDESGGLVGVDVRSKVPTAMLDVMAKKLDEAKIPFARFIMVTPHPPGDRDRELFKAAYAKAAKVVDWYSPVEFFRSLGFQGEVDLDAPEFLEKLKNAALSKNVFHQSAPESAGAPKPESTAVRSARIEKRLEEDKTPSPLFQSLTRKMSYATLREFKASGQSVEQYFHIGESTREAVIVQTDLKNFSRMVRAANPQDLNEALNRYYREARRLVFDYGGVLDKFIGDSVLAVFNYPRRSAGAFADAIRFAAGVILMGREVFSELQRKMDEKIELATRVGAAVGELWTLNIGVEDVDLTFFGDKLNLAARLEHHCEPDGVLISNILYARIAETDPDFFAKLSAAPKELSTEEAKGQENVIQARQIPAAVVPALTA